LQLDKLNKLARANGGEKVIVSNGPMNRLIVSRLCALYIHHMFIIILFVGQYEYFVGPHTQATQYYFDDVQTAFRIGVNDFSVCACVSSK
jgi:hypothetical protein